MTESECFKRPNKVQLLVVLLALALACFIEASSDWVASLDPPSMTVGAIALDAVGLLLIGLLIGVPVTILGWNKLVSPIFSVPKIQYVHALVLVTAAYWIRGL